jgi:MFS family permease
MSTESMTEGRIIETKIPARLDRLPWARWHWMVLIGLGTVWILDGLEVTIVGTISSRLTEDGSGISISEGQIGQAAAIYVAGACIGALFFGWLADRLGRKKLFLITLAVYLAATVATAFSGSFLVFAICRFFTGAGIGGEYAAINSAIDELIPARVRGTVDLIINGSFWLGTAAGAALSIVLLNEDIFAADVGWRLAFGLGAVLGVGILIVRKNVPESPRWMFIHGKADEADELVSDIERQVKESAGVSELKPAEKSIKVREQERVGFITIAKTVFGAYPKRTTVGLSLFIGQAFLYNAVFFTYALVLTKFYGVKDSSVGYYIIPFAIGNFVGPLVLGRLFDSVGRKPMIAGTYILSGLLLVITAFLFKADVWTAETQTAAWCVIFFFASAGASSAYLTVSEIFPMETRALAIAFFYAVGTAVGGITGPLLFGKLIETGKETNVFWGYILGASLMIAAGIVQAVLGIEAARRDLEDIAKPLSAEAVEGDEEEAPRPQAAAAARRRRFGPSEFGSSYSPVQQSSSRVPDEDIDEEVAALVGALRDAGGDGLGRRTLGDTVNCRLWGPGRFRHALATAMARGEIRRSGRGRFVLEEESLAASR